MKSYTFKVHIFQPALAAYRIDLFRRLAGEFGDNFKVYYSDSDLGKLTNHDVEYPWATKLGAIKRIFRGMDWQAGAASVRFQKGDVVVVCGNPKTISTIALLIKAKISGASTIWWGQYWGANTTKFRQRVRMSFAKLADNILLYTDDEAIRFKDDGRKCRGTVLGLNNSVDTGSIISLRAPYDFGKRKGNILYIGRVTSKANFDLLTSAMMDPRMQGMKLHVIGSNEPVHFCGDNYKEFKERFVWHGEMTDEPAISEVANLCFCFAYAGQVGLSIVHAMAYGLPAIVHNNRLRHMPEITVFKEARTGISFMYGSASSLTERILELNQSEEVATRMSTECIDLIDGSYSTEKMASKFIESIKHAADQRG